MTNMFSMDDAEKPMVPREKIYFQEGEHLCKILEIKEHTGNSGHWFICELEVVEGPTPAGTISSYMVCPDNATGKRKDGSQAIPRETAVKRERGKIRACIAAAFGYPESQAQLITNEVYKKVVSTKDNPIVSPLVGRHLTVHSNGKWYTVKPAPTQPVLETSVPTQPVPAPPPPTPAPGTPTFPPEGWQQHPSNPAYYYKGTEVLTKEQLEARG